jgi:hypothetical protein
MRAYLSILILVLVVTVVTTSFAQVPGEISYQGRLTDSSGDPVADGNYSIQFTLWDVPGGEGHVEWTSGFQTINTTGGLFNYQLGSNVALPTDLWNNKSEVWLEIEIMGDPPISPRTKLAAAPYAYNAATVGPDLVLGNEATKGTLSLGDAGLTVTGVALDGDFTGLGGALAAYDELENPYFVALPDQDDSGGFFEIWRNETDGGFIVDGNNGLTGDPLVLIDAIGSANDFIFDPGNADPDFRAQIPADAISNGEILDEPGLASQLDENGEVTLTGTMQDVETVTIDIPSDGYVLLIGQCRFEITGGSMAAQMSLQIDENQGGFQQDPYHATTTIDNFPTASYYEYSMSVQRIYFKSAGSYTFRLEARKVGLQTIKAVDPTLTAVYLPTSYGSVSTITPNPEKFSHAEVIQTLSGEARYKADLRELELRAKEARIEALEAEKELRRVRSQQSAIDTDPD